METAGMTQGSHAEAQCNLEMDSVEDQQLRDETESMDDDQDGEVEWQMLLQPFQNDEDVNFLLMFDLNL